ncbi:MAG: 4Fe-4S dicluster domain-containing protein [Euryarchaeota archaeon]|nr:4Fe-4S dicluster domain-containing protein [Euryarchaeota archaeon]
MPNRIKISRRKFIKVSIASVATGAIMASSLKEISAEPFSSERYAILFDGFACTGCELCQFGCKERNELPHDFETFLSPITWLYVSTGAHDGEQIRMRYSCMHCHEPKCVEVCPVGAATKSEKTDLVYIDPSICIGCQYCVVACPYEVPQFDPVHNVTRKCSGCYDLVEKGLEPACVQQCPWNALHFKKRDEIVKMAEDIAARNPGSYIYGLEERGGLNVIYVLPVDPVKAGLIPDIGKIYPVVPSPLLGIVSMIGIGLIKGALYWREKRIEAKT